MSDHAQRLRDAGKLREADIRTLTHQAMAIGGRLTAPVADGEVLNSMALRTLIQKLEEAVESARWLLEDLQ